MFKPDTTLRPGTHRELIAQVEGGESRARMFECERRRMILEDDWRPLVFAHMTSLGYSPEVLGALTVRLKRNSNVAAKVLRKVALAYRQPPHRTIKDASDETQKAFRTLVLEQAKLATLPQRWERQIWMMNVAITVPVVYPSSGQFGSRLAYETFHGANTEVVTAELSPSAEPIASVTTLVPYGATRWGDKRYLVIDAEAWTTYDAKGHQIHRVPHGAGVWPGTVWRRQYGSDWWMRQAGEGLVDATIEVAHIAARLDWIRQGQDHKREFLFCEHSERIPSQIAGADAAIHIPLSQDEAKYVIEDAAVAIDQHVAHMVMHARDGVESIEVDADLLDYKEGSEGLDIIVAAQKHDDLVALRAATIEHLRLSEKDSAYKTALVLRGARHPQSRLLQPDEVAESFQAHWSELDFVDHPAERLNVMEHEINLGLKSTIDAFMAQHRGMSRDEAKAEVRRIDEEEAERAEFLATRNTPRLLRDRRSNVPELQGRIGGLVSGEQRNETDDDRSDPGADDAPPTDPARSGTAGGRSSTARTRSRSSASAGR